MDIELSGFDEVSKNLENASDELMEKIMKNFTKAMIQVERDVKINCPVDEGRLRASITHEVENTDEVIEGAIFTNVEYAPFVEMGTGIYAENGRQTPWYYQDKNGNTVKTVGQNGKHFMQDAADKNKDKLLEIIKDGVI
ncbi:phage protein, HK97 gp10 family [Hathewaya proteolytica DSM 3090]|uniref:Phage protein, HK97 gp10 family n=1 Tax=Hathewaya proteolytica DSM 3090 TaxID=1121331 RepID=A0A1M6L1A6_9CLOT|nr:HK97-gp10 family putative phage morphogenesis protein [Hathewaya proteolytica]SHJ64892.1 phage protein, HK97 gp10 family [Hathewaya proteolytica DSM 3090]